jgi:hypothetical protein
MTTFAIIVAVTATIIANDDAAPLRQVNDVSWAPASFATQAQCAAALRDKPNVIRDVARHAQARLRDLTPFNSVVVGMTIDARCHQFMQAREPQ